MKKENDYFKLVKSLIVTKNEIEKIEKMEKMEKMENAEEVVNRMSNFQTIIFEEPQYNEKVVDVELEDDKNCSNSILTRFDPFFEFDKDSLKFKVADLPISHYSILKFATKIFIGLLIDLKIATEDYSKKPVEILMGEKAVCLSVCDDLEKSYNIKIKDLNDETEKIEFVVTDVDKKEELISLLKSINELEVEGKDIDVKNIVNELEANDDFEEKNKRDLDKKIEKEGFKIEKHND